MKESIIRAIRICFWNLLGTMTGLLIVKFLIS